MSVVSGCVTSNPGTLYSQSAPRSVEVKQTAETTSRTAKIAQAGRPAIILGAAY